MVPKFETKIYLGILILSFIFLFTGCAHVPIHPLPSSVHTVYVQMFKNQSFQYGMEERLTNAVIKELIADHRLRVVNTPEQADAILSGTITNYTRDVLAFDRDGNVEMYTLTLTAAFVLKDSRTNEIIRQRKAVLANTTYVPKRSRIEFEREQDARTRLLTDLADEIVNRIFE
jgi:hypothetical protein